MDACDDLGLGDHQEIVVALNILRDVGKALAAIVRFFQLMALNQSAHAAVQNMYTLLHVLFQSRNSLLALLNQVVVV